MIALVPPIEVTITERCELAPRGERHAHAFEARARDGSVLTSASGGGPVGRLRALVNVRETAAQRGWTIVATELVEPRPALEALSVVNTIDRLFLQGILPESHD